MTVASDSANVNRSIRVALMAARTVVHGTGIRRRFRGCDNGTFDTAQVRRAGRMSAVEMSSNLPNA